MKKKQKKPLNAELVKVQERVDALEQVALEAAQEKNLLQEEMAAELDKIRNGTARIESIPLKCRHRPVKD